MMEKRPSLPSLTIFFPFYNDAGTVSEAIELAYRIGHEVTKNLEVIALYGGNSHDDTWNEIQLTKKKFPELRIINREHNTEGYAVIKHGLKGAKKKWVFYTDGDLQYDVRELVLLVEAQNRTGADVVNGYKIKRSDGWVRTLFGKLWQSAAESFFRLPIRDVDCDFRLIQTDLLKPITLTARGASVLEELILKLEQQGGAFVEVPVHHFGRKYGQSNYKTWQLVMEKIPTIRFWTRFRR